jgi:hypothetical protein
MCMCRGGTSECMHGEGRMEDGGWAARMGVWVDRLWWMPGEAGMLGYWDTGIPLRIEDQAGG